MMQAGLAAAGVDWIIGRLLAGGGCQSLFKARANRAAAAQNRSLEPLGQLMAEVDDPALRRTVLGLCVSVAEADDHLSDGESALLVAAVEIETSPAPSGPISPPAQGPHPAGRMMAPASMNTRVSPSSARR